MKILAINGSHRKGNIDFMLDILLNSARENGAETELIQLRKKDIKFCNAGDSCCPVTKKCNINDDMIGIYNKLGQADIIVLASPSYFSNVSARMKNLMDRCNPYWFNKKLKGKQAFLIGVGGSGEKSIKEMLDRMRTFIRILGIEELGSYYTKADKTGEANNSKVIKELKEIGVRLSK